MWRRLLWWTSDRPAVLPWAILLSLVLLVVGDSNRQSIASIAAEYLYAPFFALKHRISASARVFEDNRILQRRIVELSLDNQRLRESAIENRRLRRLLELPAPWESDAIPGEVVTPISPGSGTMWIETGLGAPIEPGWPVATEDGLIGKVVEVKPPLARVRTLWDQLSRVAAYDQRSRTAGILAWESGPTLQMTYVQPSADVWLGDTVISSGWGGVFPKGVCIGTIVSIDTIHQADFLDIRVMPMVRAQGLEYVFVMRPSVMTVDSTIGEAAP